LPDPALVRARLAALAGLERPADAVDLRATPVAEPAVPGPSDAAEPTGGPGPTGAPATVRAGAGRALVVLALVAVAVAGWLTWRAQGGDVTATLVSPGVSVASSAAAVGVPSAAASASVAPEVVVQVLGVVRRPGVYRLAAGSRVADAIEAAGGLRPGRSSGLLNLARLLVDGEQIVVSPKATASPPTTPAMPTGDGTSAGPVDLNTADAAALDTLPGVGPVTAQAILDWREANGRFGSVDQLREVDGIGPKTFERLAPLVTVGP
jgi:competence protein ComEA